MQTDKELLEQIANLEREAEKADRDGAWMIAASCRSYVADLKRGMVQIAGALPPYNPDEK